MADLQIAQNLGLDCLPIGSCKVYPAECAKQEAIALSAVGGDHMLSKAFSANLLAKERA